MRFLSVCSGVEAASVAWGPLGWSAWALSEIDRNPSLVLAHHYPRTPNLGDMTKFQEWPNGDIDLLCGGTPCQSFSLSGLRKGLDDPRGNLMLTFGAIAARYRPRWLVWENVPGVLSSNGGRDFGSFLGLLGVIGYGFAYRVLDAQHFGVPQRRERVFVVGHLGSWQPAAAVLFERDSLRRHPAARRRPGGGDTGAVAPSLTAQSNAAEGQAALAKTAAIHRATLKPPGFSGYNLGSDYVEEKSVTMMASTAPLIGFSQRGLKENGSWQEGRMPSMQCEAPVVMSGFAGFHGGVAPSSEVVPTLASVSAERLIVGGAGNRQSRRGMNKQGEDVASTLMTHSRAFNARTFVIDEGAAHGFNHHRAGQGGDVMPSLTVGSPGGADCAPRNAIGFTRASNLGTSNRDVVGALTTKTGSGTYQEYESGGQMIEGAQGDVRKLTPIECEVLQGFPPGYTAVPTRKRNKAMEDPEMLAYQRRVLAHLGYTDEQLMTLLPDGARYKALGNSWAVPNARWVGERIQAVDDILRWRDLGLLG